MRWNHNKEGTDCDVGSRQTRSPRDNVLWNPRDGTGGSSSRKNEPEKRKNGRLLGEEHPVDNEKEALKMNN